VQEVDPEIGPLTAAVSAKFGSPEVRRSVIVNMYKAHKKYIEEGLDNFSEYTYLRNVLGASLDAADRASELTGGPQGAYWSMTYA
jgi:hypothetical protein